MVSDYEIKNIFYRLELLPQLYSFRINNISLYFLLRFRIEMIYRNKIGRIQTPPLSNCDRLKYWLSTSWSIFKTKIRARYILKETATPIIGESPLLFVSTSSWAVNQKESIELTEVIKYYKRLGLVVNFIQPDFDGNTIEKQSYIDGFYKIFINKLKILTSSEKKIIKEFVYFLSKNLDTIYRKQLELFELYVRYQISMSLQLSNYIKASRAKYIFARSVYTEPWVPVACKMCKVMCVEVQHGVVTPDSIYYRSSSTSSPDKYCLFFPDYILTLGERWNKVFTTKSNQFSSKNVFTLGLKNLPQKKQDDSVPFTVLVCLQHGIFDINPLIISLISCHKDILLMLQINLIIRPHPNYVDQTVQHYSRYIREGIAIQDPRKTDFYDSLAFADALISHSSMCLYEALSIKVPAISVVDAKGVVIEDGIYFVKTSAELLDLIIKFQNKEIKSVQIPYLSSFNEHILDHFLN